MDFLVYIYVLLAFIVLVVAVIGYSIIKENKRSVTLGGDPQYKRWGWLRRLTKRKKRKKRRH